MLYFSTPRLKHNQELIKIKNILMDYCQKKKNNNTTVFFLTIVAKTDNTIYSTCVDSYKL